MLHYAVQRGNTDLIASLLTSPDAATFLMPDFSGRTLLHYATESSRPDTINMMLEGGIDLDVIDNQGRTVLHHAAMRGNLAATRRLIEIGAAHQLSYKDRNGHTPVDLACQYDSETVRDYFESLGHSGHNNGKQSACLSSEKHTFSEKATGASWKMAILLLLVLGIMYWSKLARARWRTNVVEPRTWNGTGYS
jgi:ankyrin repeat protein